MGIRGNSAVPGAVRDGRDRNSEGLREEIRKIWALIGGAMKKIREPVGNRAIHEWSLDVVIW